VIRNNINVKWYGVAVKIILLIICNYKTVSKQYRTNWVLVQWYNTCLAYSRTSVPAPAPNIKTKATNKTKHTNTN
jgi:hypothetical protein